jgi:hypothetical protein
MSKIRERLAVRKQTTHRVHMERFCVEISNRFEALENLDTEVDDNEALGTITEIKMYGKKV